VARARERLGRPQRGPSILHHCPAWARTTFPPPHASAASPRLCSLFRRFLLRASATQRHDRQVVALVARILEDLRVLVPRQGDIHSPRRREDIQIFDRRLVADRVRIDAPEAFDQTIGNIRAVWELP
jgi:hypothetical protein